MRRSLTHTLFWTQAVVLAAACSLAGWLAVRRAASGGGAVVPVAVAIGSAGALALALWWARRLIRPLQRLGQVAQSIARGEPIVSVPPHPVAELHDLGQALASTSQAIQHSLQTLTTERNQVRIILESMTDGVMALSGDGRVLVMNPSAGSVFGVRTDNVVGRPLLEAVRNPELHGLVTEALDRRAPLMREWTLLQPQERVLRVHAVPTPAAPAGVSLVIVIQDLTASSQYDRLRREFSANVSHELKSPLAGIQSLIETLLDGALEDAGERRRFVQLMDDETRRLARLIEDLLQLAQLDAGAVPLQPTAVPLASFLDGLLPGLQAGLDKRKVRLTVTVDPALQVRADPDRLRQILVNLLENAVTYNREGGVVEVSADVDGRHAHIRVRDTGVGIPEADLSRLFERFYRVDKARSRELGGTGLGLSIVKHLVESHGGSIAVASRPGEGSTFTVSLPRTT